MSRGPSHEPERDVLDANLALLLSRAYVPVRPTAAFRAALNSTLGARLRARVSETVALPVLAPRAPGSETHTASAPRPRSTRTFAWQLAAALLVCLLGGVFVARAFFGGPGTHDSGDCAEFLARGEVAVRTDGGAWRAFDARERAHGFEHAGGALELATPRERGASVWLASAGSAAFEARSRAGLDLGAGAGSAAAGARLALEFTEGALALERLAAGETWRVHTSQGDFELARGKLELAYVGPELATGGRSVRAKLVWGAASFLAEGGALALTAGDATIVRAQQPNTFAPLTSAELAARTSAADPAAAPSASTSLPAVPAAQHALLRAHVELAAGAELRGAWQLSVLRAVRLPEVGEPETRTFAADARDVEFAGLEPGVYELFATLPGFGDWRARDVVLASGETLAIVITPLAPARASGRVLDARTQQPIEGAWVVSETDAPAAVLPFDFALDTEADWSAWSCLARTGPDGRFELRQLSAGRHVFRVTAPGHAASWTTPVELAAGASTDELVVSLGAPGRIVATVPLAHEPVATGPRVIASRVEFDTLRRCISFGCALEAPGGRAEIEGLAPGLYVVFEVVAGRASASMRQVVVRAGEETRVAFEGGERGARLHGTLRLASGAPAPGIDVSLMPARGVHVAPGAGESWINERSDDAGRFEFPALAPGTYEIYAGRGVGTQFVRLDTLDVPDVNEFAHDLVLGAGELAGVVRRADDGTPLASAQVILEREENGGWYFAGRYVTDGLGRWRAEFVPLGRVRAAAYTNAGRLAPATAGPFELAAGAVQQVDLALAPGAELALSVRDTAGAALANVALEFEAADGSRQRFSRDDTTGASGRFDIGGIAAGTWKIRARREGFAALERTIEVFAGERQVLELVLERAADENSGANRPR